MKVKKKEQNRQKFNLKLLKRQKHLLFMSVPFVIWAFIFCYIPLWGWTMAFQDVRPATYAKSFWERDFVGFDNFIKAFTDRLFPQTMLNTLAMSVRNLFCTYAERTPVSEI